MANKSQEEIKKKVKKLIEVLYAQKDGQLINKKGRALLQRRLTIEELSRITGLSIGTIHKVITLESWHWEWLRAEGVKPNAWKLRLNTYGSVRHFKKCAMHEYKWRYEQGAIKKKEKRRLELQVKKDLMSISGVRADAPSHRVKLQMMYVRLKGWDAQRVQKAKEQKA